MRTHGRVIWYNGWFWRSWSILLEEQLVVTGRRLAVAAQRLVSIWLKSGPVPPQDTAGSFYQVRLRLVSLRTLLDCSWSVFIMNPYTLAWLDKNKFLDSVSQTAVLFLFYLPFTLLLSLFLYSWPAGLKGCWIQGSIHFICRPNSNSEGAFHLAAVWIDRPEELWQGSLPSVAGSSQFVPLFLLPR